MIDTNQYEKFIYGMKDMDDVKDYLKELTRFVLYDLAWGRHEAHDKFLKNLVCQEEFKKFRVKDDDKQ